MPTINNDGDITSIVSANQASGFSIVEYTGNGAANATVAHGLGIQCRLVIVKRLLGGYNWMVGYLNSSNQQHSLYLNTTAARDNELNRSPQAFNTTTFQLGSIANAHTNGSTDKYIAYCFADIAGYQKIGSYTGSNSSSKVVTTGFQPRFLLIKSTTSNGNYWNMFDSARTTAPNGKGRLYANGIFAEDGTLDIIFDSTSFEILTSNSDINGSNDYLYLAIA